MKNPIEKCEQAEARLKKARAALHQARVALDQERRLAGLTILEAALKKPETQQAQRDILRKLRPLLPLPLQVFCDALLKQHAATPGKPGAAKQPVAAASKPGAAKQQPVATSGRSAVRGKSQ